jgi:hypothetical protein
MIKHLLRMPAPWARRCSGIGMKFGCVFLLGAIVLTAGDGYAQTLFGDASATLGGFGRYRLEAGRGIIDSYHLHFKGKVVSVVTNQFSAHLTASETTGRIESEMSFLTATVGLTRSIDVLLTVGQFRTQTLFDGNYGPAGGLGLRLSPPQAGLIRMGLLVQVFYGTSKNDGYDAKVDTQFEPDSRYIERHIVATGTAEDKLRLISYDLLLGIDLQNIPLVRPHGGVLVSVQNRTENGSFSGQGNVATCPFPGTICLTASTPVSLSWNSDVSSDKVFAGLIGLSITPVDWIGADFEYVVGRGHIGNQRGFMASVFVDF